LEGEKTSWAKEIVRLELTMTIGKQKEVLEGYSNIPDVLPLKTDQLPLSKLSAEWGLPGNTVKKGRTLKKATKRRLE